jgi:hypothetical protein
MLMTSGYLEKVIDKGGIDGTVITRFLAGVARQLDIPLRLR